MLPMPQLSKRNVLAMLLVSVLVGCAHPQPTLRRFEYAQPMMGVRARIILYEDNQGAADEAARAAFARLRTLEEALSGFRPGSELSRLNARAGRGPIEVSEELYQILHTAQQVSSMTSGAFDVTVGPLTQLWREARAQGQPPSAERIAHARKRVGWELMRLDEEARTVELLGEGMQLDLGGIGKGYAADDAVKLLAAVGVRTCLVDLGGDLALGDPPPNNKGWIVEIEALSSETGPYLASLSNCGVATSGDRFQFIEFDDVRHSHIVDPRTGLALTDRRTVTVIASDGALADALASALSVVTIDEALALLEEIEEAGGCLLLETGGVVQIRLSRGFPEARQPLVQPQER